MVKTLDFRFFSILEKILKKSGKTRVCLPYFAVVVSCSVGIYVVHVEKILRKVLNRFVVEFEGRFRRWRLFNRRGSGGFSRSSSQEPNPNLNKVKNTQNVCYTSPIPRKNMNRKCFDIVIDV